MARVGIINYGMGNLRSVANAVEAVGGEPCILDRPIGLSETSHIILPGVGAFGDGMKNLRASGWVDALEREVFGEGRPFLGICLGMQLIADTSTEHGPHQGTGWIPGTVERIESNGSDIRIPHIGWNDVRILKKDKLFAGLGEKQTFYFVHSYVLNPEEKEVIAGVCSYGTDFAASIEKENIFATQFHPEKSQKAGLAVLRNFLKVL